MTEVFDLDALDAEANQVPFAFKFDGREYTCADDISIPALKAIEADNILGAFEAFVGPEQWQSLIDAHKTFGVVRMAKVLGEYAKHLGIELPNL